jgi:iron complex transport system ATP-binding protein
VLSLLRAINRERGTTIVAVLHDLNHAMALCDRVLLLKGAGMYAIGAPEEVLTSRSIRDVYGIEAEIAYSGSTGRATIIPRIDVA